MKKGKIRKKVLIREFVQIPGLEIDETVFDVPIRFSRGDAEVQIRFPDRRDGGSGQIEIESSGTRTERDGVKTEHFDVSGVEIIVRNPGQLELPAAAETVFPRREQHYTKTEIKNLDHCLEELRTIGNGALTEWIEICRWTTGNSIIGDTPRDFYAYMPDPNLRIASSDHRFWCHDLVESRTIIVRRTVTLGNWQEIERRLVAGVTTPIWFAYIFEAENKLFRRDFRGAVLSAAIACETLIRKCLQREIDNTGSSATDELIDQINLRQILNKFKKFNSIEIPKKAVFSIGDVHKLFNLRNNEMHSAALKNADRNEVDKLIRNARKFIDFIYPQLDMD